MCSREGNGASISVLDTAGVPAGLLVMLRRNLDRTNLVCCLIAKLGAQTHHRLEDATPVSPG